MARKPSVIMSAAERKEATNDLKGEITAQKAALKEAAAAVKTAEKAAKEAAAQAAKDIKALVKEHDAIAKALQGLETRKAALSPPKPLLG